MGKYFGTDGFRGEAGVTLTADHAYKVGRFLGWYYGMLRQRNGEATTPRIVIGKDTRRSSYMFEYSLVAGLTASGADAYLLHVTTTPSVAYIARVDDFDCGIMISASHNPFYDNGIKLIDRSGEKMDEATIALIEDYLDGQLHVFGADWPQLPLAHREQIGRTVDWSAGRNRYVGYLISLGMFSFKGKKVGIVVKGCDSRSVVELLQENLINRDDVTIFAMPCEGTLDMARVDKELGRYNKIDSVVYDEAGVTVTADGKEHRFCMTECAQGKCYGCTMPTAQLADTLAGAPTTVEGTPGTPPELALLDSMTLPERMAFWRGQMERCLRCYACRNACPMCVCRDYCVAESRDPHWMTQEDSVREKLYFQTIHALHLAGRCTGCGECQRACPVGIPILALRQQIGRAVSQLFDGYKAGMDPEAVPPLLGYELEEKNIHEREWK